MNIQQPTLYKPLFQAHFQPFPRHIAAGFEQRTLYGGQ